METRKHNRPTGKQQRSPEQKAKLLKREKTSSPSIFPTPLLAITAARALQQKLQSQVQGPVAERIVAAVTISHLLQGTPGAANQQDSPTAVIACSDRLKKRRTGPDTVDRRNLRRGKGHAGNRVPCSASNDDTGNPSNTYELIWAEEHAPVIRNGAAPECTFNQPL